ncbi:uncharacterized protein EDB93DRAFT_646538 [Suillus bovinus]|uniref:uncharacterized protein n=1 Tax=Suillus bovinus TaxID=48563 RepID=UPI001B877E58|nr:uncharacterized protein EDB93DRAFT_646538 [Suillus bovinus]KAG2140924.1 hypothetical protein EDB93DRAFT_646538 [Suillus bovinus]
MCVSLINQMSIYYLLVLIFLSCRRPAQMYFTLSVSFSLWLRRDHRLLLQTESFILVLLLLSSLSTLPFCRSMAGTSGRASSLPWTIT